MSDYLLPLFDKISSWFSSNGRNLSPEQKREVERLLHNLRSETNRSHQNIVEQVTSVQNIMHQTTLQYDSKLRNVQTDYKTQIGNYEKKIAGQEKKVGTLEESVSNIRECQVENNKFFYNQFDRLNKEIKDLKIQVEKEKDKSKEKGSDNSKEKDVKKDDADALENETRRAIKEIADLLKGFGEKNEQTRNEAHQTQASSFPDPRPCGSYNPDNRPPFSNANQRMPYQAYSQLQPNPLHVNMGPYQRPPLLQQPLYFDSNVNFGSPNTYPQVFNQREHPNFTRFPGGRGQKPRGHHNNNLIPPLILPTDPNIILPEQRNRYYRGTVNKNHTNNKNSNNHVDQDRKNCSDNNSNNRYQNRKSDGCSDSGYQDRSVSQSRRGNRGRSKKIYTPRVNRHSEDNTNNNTDSDESCSSSTSFSTTSSYKYTSSHRSRTANSSNRSNAQTNVNSEKSKMLIYPTRNEAYLKNINIYGRLNQRVLAVGVDRNGQNVVRHPATLRDVYEFEEHHTNVKVMEI